MRKIDKVALFAVVPMALVVTTAMPASLKLQSKGDAPAATALAPTPNLEDWRAYLDAVDSDLESAMEYRSEVPNDLSGEEYEPTYQEELEYGAGYQGPDGGREWSYSLVLAASSMDNWPISPDGGRVSSLFDRARDQYNQAADLRGNGDNAEATRMLERADRTAYRAAILMPWELQKDIPTPYGATTE